MWDIFSGEKKKPEFSFSYLQYTHYLGRKAAVLITVLDKCVFLLLSFFFSVGINFWGLFFFFSFKMVCCVFKYNTVAVLNSGIIVINCSS